MKLKIIQKINKIKNNIIQRKTEEKNLLTNERKENNLIKKIFLSFIFIFLIIIVFLIYEKFLQYKNKDFKKFKDILPRKVGVKNDFTSLEEIFNSRVLIITDANLTEEYIRYIRPLKNETEEEKYIINNSENQKVYNDEYFNKRKRKDQLDYREFLKICVENKLINSNKIEYDNKPLISIILHSYNKFDDLMTSIRSIQNQSFKNIEIIIVDDCSTDNSKTIFKYLLETDPRIRIFTHLKNMGAWRTRIDGFLYSRAKYMLFFDTGDLYEDNYVLEDFYNLIEKNNLDSVKMIFRIIHSYYNCTKNSYIPYHSNENSKIIYEKSNITDVNLKVFNFSKNIFNRIIRTNIYEKGLYLLKDRVLNIYKNLYEDIWQNAIIDEVSHNLLIVERVGYMYYKSKSGFGDIKLETRKQKDLMIQECINFLIFDYFFLPKEDNKTKIIKKLHRYIIKGKTVKLEYFQSNFYILNDLLNLLINDPYVSETEKPFLNKLLNESKNRENNAIKGNQKF